MVTARRIASPTRAARAPQTASTVHTTVLPRILITGFNALDEDDINPSERAVRALHKRRVTGHGRVRHGPCVLCSTHPGDMTGQNVLVDGGAYPAHVLAA